jgi:hypothetical protein
MHVPFSLPRIIMSGDGSAGLHLLIPQYGYLLSLICFHWFWYMSVTVFFFVKLYPLFPWICWSVVVHSLLSCLFIYCSFVSIGLADIIWSIIIIIIIIIIICILFYIVPKYAITVRKPLKSRHLKNNILYPYDGKRIKRPRKYASVWNLQDTALLVFLLLFWFIFF